MPGTNLTTNGNFGVFTGEKDMPLLAKATVQYFRGSFIMFDAAGLAIPVPANNGATDNSTKRVVGQNQTQPGTDGTAVATDQLSVRTDAVAECNQIAGQFVQADAGALAYASSDNEITKVAALNPKVGIFLGFSARGLPLVSLSFNTPA